MSCIECVLIQLRLNKETISGYKYLYYYQVHALKFNLQMLSVFTFYRTENIEELSKRLVGGDILSFMLILSLKVLKLTDY
jgi:hypothetical protein